MMRLVLIITLILSASAPVLARPKAQPPKALKDVPKTHWASDAVQDLYESGVMVGDPTGAFRGGSAMTRYEMAVALSSLINNYNKELLEDREDLASLVNIMEQFQNELSALNQKLNQINQSLGIVTTTVDVVQGQSEEVAAKVDETGAELAVIKQDITKLQNRGLIYGTLIKGTANDIKSVGKGAAYVAKKIGDRKPKETSSTKEVEAEVIEQVVVPKPAQTQAIPNTVEEPQAEEADVILSEAKDPSHEEESEEIIEPVKPVEVKKQEEPKKKVEEVKPALQDTGRHSYVPKMQANPAQPSYESPKAQAPAPKAMTKEEDHHSHEYSHELDGELIQEIHQTLQEMH